MPRPRILKICVSFIVLCLVILAVSPHSVVLCQSSIPADSVKAYQEDLQKWHESRIRGLTRENGWLSLVALQWLDEGTNEVPDFGTVTMSAGAASFEAAIGISSTVEGKPFLRGILTIESGGNRPTKVAAGSKAFIVIKRGDLYAVRMWDANAATRLNFTGVDRYPVDLRWRVEARWIPFDTVKSVPIPTIVPGYTEESRVPGAAAFSIEGKEYRLEPMQDDPASDLFFVFGDKTNGKGTYPAGRFLYAAPPKDGKVILDFNRSVNPPCAFTPFATCPLPRPENVLPLRVESGEKNWGIH